MNDDLEKRVQKLERLIQTDERLRRLELLTVRVTASVLLEMALVALLVWSFFHLVNFVRSLLS